MSGIHILMMAAAPPVIQSYTGSISNNQFILNSNGSRSPLDSESAPQYWISPQSNMNAYSVRATQISTTGTGTFTGTIGSFLNLGMSRNWEVITSSPTNPAVWTIDFEFRRDSDGVILQTNRIILISTP